MEVSEIARIISGLGKFKWWYFFYYHSLKRKTHFTVAAAIHKIANMLTQMAKLLNLM